MLEQFSLICANHFAESEVADDDVSESVHPSGSMRSVLLSTTFFSISTRIHAVRKHLHFIRNAPPSAGN